MPETSSNSKKANTRCSYFSRAKKLVYHFKWKIDHFNLICKCIETITSPIFPQEKENLNQWVIEIKQRTEKKREIAPFDLITFNIISKKGIQEYVDYSLSLKYCDQIHKIHDYHGIATDLKVLSKEMKTRDLINIFQWTNTDEPQPLTVIVDICVLHSLQDFHNKVNVKNIEHVKCLNYIHHANSIMEFEDFKDFVFIVKNEKFPVHKIILARESPVFATMFLTKMNENMTATAEINDVEPDAFRKMLHCIYHPTMEKENFQNSVFDLLHLAHKYEMKQLETTCTEFLYKELSASNVVEVLYAASLYEISELKEKALVCLKFNLDAIKDSEDFKNLIVKNPNIAADLVSIETGPTLNDNFIGQTKCSFKRNSLNIFNCCCCFASIFKRNSSYSRLQDD